ncbi:MAG: endonuclease/exonuclease/phosphatase family metal-dependent hydrolase [Myxococcota bacterium]|jgi:endonuclease/exonuclease/phosphatase family metal-dependent hydrolase
MLYLVMLACTAGDDTRTVAEDTGPDGAGYGEIVPFRAATFNIDWLSPRDSDRDDVVPRNSRDREMIRTLITEYDLSLVALQEIEGAGAISALGFDDSWSWVAGDSGWSLNPALLYRSDRFSVTDVFEVELPGQSDGYRDPLVAVVEHTTGLSFVVVVVHLAAYDDDASSSLRQGQATSLHGWLSDDLAGRVGADLAERVMLLGDFNDTVGGINDRYPSLSVFDEDEYWRIATKQVDGASTVYFSSVIDHAILSPEMTARWTGESSETGCNVIYHDAIDPWASYGGGYGDEQNISSHRPVTLGFNAGTLD